MSLDDEKREDSVEIILPCGHTVRMMDEKIQRQCQSIGGLIRKTKNLRDDKAIILRILNDLLSKKERLERKEAYEGLNDDDKIQKKRIPKMERWAHRRLSRIDSHLKYMNDAKKTEQKELTRFKFLRDGWTLTVSANGTRTWTKSNDDDS